MSGNNSNLIVKELPNIQYDRDLLVPEIVEKKKWNIIYVGLAIVGVFVSVFFSVFVKEVQSKKHALAEETIKYCDLKPRVDKIETVGKGTNIENILVSQFMLENLFFVDTQNFEIVNSMKSFFASPEVRSMIGTFEMNNVVLSEESAGQDVSRIPIKLDGKFSSMTDLTNMLSILSKMVPVIVIEKTELGRGNSVTFRGYVYNFKKNLFVYDYVKKYQDINEIIKLKEIFQKNNKILKTILKDPELGLEKMGVVEIYDCKQYADILKMNNLTDFKKEELDMCKDVEKLVNDNRKQMDDKFNAFIKKSTVSSESKINVNTATYSQEELGIDCNDVAPLKVDTN